MSDSHADLTEYSDEIWRTACRLLGDPEDAHECFQQTFVDALKIDPNHVRNWGALLCGIATRRAMDLLRRRYRDNGAMQPLASEPREEDPPEADLEFQELRDSVRQRLAALPANQGEAFWLRHIECLSPEEIGRQLDIEVGHVRVLVHRAVKHLRTSLPPEHGELLAQREKA